MKKIILKKALLLFCMVCGNVAAYAIGGDGCYFVQTFEDLTTYPETKPDTETAFNVESQGEWLYLGAFQATNASYIPDGSEHNLRMTKNGSYVITPVVSNGISRVTFDIGRASVKVYTSADGGATWAEATQTVSGKKVTITAFTASQTYFFSKSVTLEAGKLYRSLAIPCGLPETVSLSSVTTTSDGVTDVGGTPTLTLQDGQLVTGSLVRTTDAHKVKVTIADGATVTLSGATIDGKAESDDAWAGITCEGDATILLTGANTVTNFDSWYPAIFVPEGKTLTIGGSGSLTASNTCYGATGSGAAIGGGNIIACGNIAITGGTITANGGYSSAAIGGGYDASCGSITISGGTVTATAAGDGGAGIGSGNVGGSGTSCGNITISGTARVTATGGGNSAGIGSACADYFNANTCGDITISGACTVIATGGGNGAGIGTGCMATCGSIRITGGTVTAQGGGNAAGIGCGQGSESRKSVCGAITIEDGGNFTSVTAIRGQDALRPIGHSSYDSNWNTCGTITFGENEIYTAGDYPVDYSIDGGGLNFEETTTVLGDPDEDTDNTWKLKR